MNIKTGKYSNKNTCKKKALIRKNNVNIKELETPYLKLVYFNPYLPVRKYW